MKINFVTGNDRKVSEARAACLPFGIEVEKLQIHVDEIQHHDPINISLDKARQAFSKANKPIVINDSTWNIPALNGFPGGYMKDVAEWFLPEDFIALMINKKDKRICCVETVIYKDKDIEKVFNKEFWGEIVGSAKGTGSSIETLASFNGKTIGEWRDNGLFAFDPKDYIWNDFAKWYFEFDK